MSLPDIQPLLAGPKYIDLIETSKPEKLEESIKQALQALPYLEAPQRRQLETHILNQGSTCDETFAHQWLRQAYFVGTRAATQAISLFLKQRVPTDPLILEAAQIYLDLLALEEQGYRPSVSSKRRAPSQGAIHTIDDLLSALNSSSSPKHSATVATDCDGTTWAGDIGEHLFETALKANQLLPEALPSLQELLRDYSLPSKNDANEDAATLLKHYESGSLLERGIAQGKTVLDVSLDYFKSNVYAFAGHNVGTIKAWTQHLFETPGGLKENLHHGVLRTLRKAEQHKLIPLAISASSLWSTELAGNYLGIPLRHCRGIATAVQNQIITAQIVDPIPYGLGKNLAIESISGGIAGLALGDSFEKTDKEMLEEAQFAGIIVPKDPTTAQRLQQTAPKHWFTIEPHTGELKSISSSGTDSPK